MGNISILNTLVIIGIVIAGFLTVIIDDILPCIIAYSAVGTFIALEFLLLRAPDVAIAEGAVGAVLTPVIFLIALHKVKGKKEKKEEKK
ncbi:Membrane bound hydrogenase subunit mbhD [Clostridium amylolyticum]|uniref:Membrane bound hydrogenase subunit mbhD n=1 Tax=Clostridium amylolyticum TaxID=1121298 RepID=A0A1M6CK94_9CLOT|nr:hydrogenase subunit MbhD domain-containing protein [Clostridium amylolyticum]SHI61174.1 Membrane bound hydrogenase subunit mbhD [Clostridium amylolyticum]